MVDTQPGVPVQRSEPQPGEPPKPHSRAGNWKYVLALPVDDKVYNVDFDDWMWQLDDKVMMNRAVFSKFGFRLGEVLITFYKQ